MAGSGWAVLKTAFPRLLTAVCVEHQYANVGQNMRENKGAVGEVVVRDLKRRRDTGNWMKMFACLFWATFSKRIPS